MEKRWWELCAPQLQPPTKKHSNGSINFKRKASLPPRLEGDSHRHGWIFLILEQPTN
jgi:hypothetical protein